MQTNWIAGVVRKRMRSWHVAALAGVLVASAACGSNGSMSADEPSTKAPTAEAADGKEVEMRLIAFMPDTLDVSPGTTVRWSQQDAGFHTVTSGTAEGGASGNVTTNPDKKFASGKLAKGKTFSFTFDDAGTYEYFCEIHPATMRGEITVG